MKIKNILAISVMFLSMSLHAESFKTLISVKGIQSKIDYFFVDDALQAALKENSKELHDINYSYSKNWTNTCLCQP